MAAPSKNSLVSLDHEGNTVPYIINPVPCVQTASEDINIRMNAKAIKRWITLCQPHEDKVIICSAGPSLEKYVDRLKEYRAKGWKISCVKHSLPRLVKAGVVPDYCVVLDPRCVIGHSTHGVKRLDLYKDAPMSVTFFVASVTDFRTADYLLRDQRKVIGWHRQVDALKAYPQYQPQLGGGSCSALGSVGLLYALGFRNMILVGFDSSYDEEPKTKLKTFKFGSKYEPNKKFIATGELGAQAQEIEDILVRNQMQIKFDVWSGGLVGNIWKHAQRNVHLPDYRLVVI
jgi:hypothetical protein